MEKARSIAEFVGTIASGAFAEDTIKEQPTAKGPMQPIQQRVVNELQTLSYSDQQKVLNFIESLKAKRQDEPFSEETEEPESFLQAARQYIGCAEGPGDLSTNPNHLQNYGH